MISYQALVDDSSNFCEAAVVPVNVVFNDPPNLDEAAKGKACPKYKL